MAVDSSILTNGSGEGRPLAARLLERWPDIAGDLVARGLGDAVPSDLPEDHYDDNVLPAVVVAGQAVLATIAAGKEPGYASVRAGTTVADRYLVVSVRLDDDSPEASSALMGGRRQRLFRSALEELTSDIVPAMFDGIEGVALLADSGQVQLASDPRWDALATDLTERLEADAYVAVMSGVVPAAVPESVGIAGELARLAMGLKRTPGAYRIDDLLLEYQVTRPSPARDRLIELVEPLYDQEHLLEAVIAHLQNGGSRKAAADGLHLHPNSYLYRLRRVHELTGLDPNSPRDSRMLAAGLLLAGRWGNPLPQ
ncbi:MAG: helix-turn-helix domain-containing protein [Gordonia sp. (in: high G+C Gram-positive bacteria)]|uniref:PucR family transcriptional regulator n=1 Tax=Gordonia sp. (in: high G+C Gram-positive bacteria) TaxID=84139 RepID=UPI0039E3AF49